MQYETKEIIKLLDSDTISALFRLYGITYDTIGIRMRMTRQAVTYKIKHDAFKDYEREIVLQLLQQHGLEISELILINKIINTAKNVAR